MYKAKLFGRSCGIIIAAGTIGTMAGVGVFETATTVAAISAFAGPVGWIVGGIIGLGCIGYGVYSGIPMFKKLQKLSREPKIRIALNEIITESIKEMNK